jgi:elongation factor P
MVGATQVRNGMIIRHNGELCRVTGVDHVTPGKGNALIRAMMVNIVKGTKVEARYRPSEKVDDVRVEDHAMQYLYSDGDDHVFMDQESFEQFNIPDSMNDDLKNFLVEEIICSVSFHEGNPIAVEPPQTVDLRIEETDPPLKGATAAGGLKPAKMQTGLVVGVPQFIETGEMIRVDCVQRKYIERVK